MVEGVDERGGAKGSLESLDSVLSRLSAGFHSVKGEKGFFDAIKVFSDYIRGEFDAGRNIHPAVASYIACEMSSESWRRVRTAYDRDEARRGCHDVEHALMNFNGVGRGILHDVKHPWYDPVLEYIKSGDASVESLKLIRQFVTEAEGICDDYEDRFKGIPIMTPGSIDDVQVKVIHAECVPQRVRSLLLGGVLGDIFRSETVEEVRDMYSVFRGIISFCDYELEERNKNKVRVHNNGSP